MSDEIIEELVIAVEGAANFMRGMTLDPQLPTTVKSDLAAKINELDDIAEKHS